ncbi:unnamed protein product [Schistocephalus solidus]|uniref:Eukaryotic translation initiation factor 2 subunit 2 n=1 Tax=Schistocephalus solidus TaxID=70667 RepID=A0A183TPG1_SCHSO|nr:unnamed protein product [Schistocephalus solidus]
MCSKENLLDFSSKKKKKKGKVVVSEASAPEPSDAPAATAAPVSEEKTVEQTSVDLPDFAKKKKKKAVTIEDGGDQKSAAAASQPPDRLETLAQPESSAPAVAVPAVNELADKLDDELGFSQKKKKKPKAFVEEEPKAAPVTVATTPDGAPPVGAVPAATDGSAGAQLPTNEMPTYTYEMLLNRVFAQLRDKNPELMSDQKRRLVMVPPCMARVGSKKTQFTNFNTICRSLSRDPAHLSAYLFAELGTTGSLDANGALLIRGKYQSKHMEPVLRNYCRTYVLCSTCQSPETNLCKESRLLFLQCQRCGSRVTVKNVTSGFQAVVGKRSAVRAKAQ